MLKNNNTAAEPEINIGAVVVTYFPPPEFNAIVARIAAQFRVVVVVDNSAASEDHPLSEIIAQHQNVVLVELGRNLGIGAALNAGVKQCVERNCQWVATFDQDTYIPSGFFQQVARVLHDIDCHDKVAMLSPSFRDGEKLYQRSLSNAPFYTLECITSGSVVNAEVLDSVGGFDESLFIDYVDHEIVLRLLKHGYRVLGVPEIIIEHKIGSGIAVELLFFSVNVTNHPPARLYTIYRNLIVVSKRYWRLAPKRILLLAGKEILRLLKIVFFEKDRKRKLIAAFSGVRSALLKGADDVTDTVLDNFR